MATKSEPSTAAPRFPAKNTLPAPYFCQNKPNFYAVNLNAANGIRERRQSRQSQFCCPGLALDIYRWDCWEKVDGGAREI